MKRATTFKRRATKNSLARVMQRLSPHAAAALVALGLTLAQTNPAMGDAPDKKTELYQSLPSMTWPLLPGENLKKLAKLFYPKNKAMQKRFIEASIVLSKEINPTLKADTAYRQPSTIIIPELEALSAMAKQSKGGKQHLRMSYRIASEPLEEVTPEMLKEYDELVDRNEKSKAELERVNRRLAELQIRMDKLKEAAEKWLEQQAKLEAENARVAALEPTNTASAPQQQSAPATLTSKNKLRPDVAAEAKTPDEKQAAPEKSVEDNQKALISKLEQLWLPSLMFLLAALVALLYVFRKRLPFKTVFSDSKPIDFDTSFKADDLAEHDSVLAMVQGHQTLSEERITSVTEDARKLISKGRTDEAIELLNDAINFGAKRSITTWLYLLDVYRNADKRIEFERLADRFHKNFNVMTPLWNPVEVNVVISNSLEEFPHVLEDLQKSWENGNADVFLDELIEDNRDGERAGFSMAVLEEMMLLKAIWHQRENLYDEDGLPLINA